MLEVAECLGQTWEEGKEGGEAERLDQVLSRHRLSQCSRAEVLLEQMEGGLMVEPVT